MIDSKRAVDQLAHRLELRSPRHKVESDICIISIGVLPALDPIRCMPRFEALVQLLNTRDPRAATVCADGSK